MCRTERPALGLVLGIICAVVSVSATASGTQPGPAGEPEQKPKAQPPAETKPAEPPSAGAPEPQAKTQDEDDAARTPRRVSSEDILKAFQKDRPTRVPIAPTEGLGAPAATPEAAPTGSSRRLPDGFFLVDRVGRLAKDGDWYVFAFEGYSESCPELPMKLLPNQLLERMVLESEGAVSSTVFIVSGEVTEFQGENYLLLRKLLRRRNLGNLER